MFSNPQQATIKILDEGLPLAYAHTIDFTGSGITGTASGSLVEEDVPGLFGEETDPVYSASSWFTTTNNADDWDTAYGWGNHADAGYALDSALVDYLYLPGRVGGQVVDDDVQFNSIGINTPFSSTYKLSLGGYINFVGVGAPTNTISASLAGLGAGNVDAGLHYYKISYYTASGETMISSARTAITVANSAVDGQVQLSNIPISTSSEVVGRRIYRTNASSTASYFLLVDIPDNITTTYLDNIADLSLGTQDNSNRDNTTRSKIYSNGSFLGFFGNYNIGLGIGSMANGANFSGYYNFGLGPYSLSKLTTGLQNTGVGAFTLVSLTSGSSNMASGFNAGHDMTTAIGNTLYGVNAGYGITTGGSNIVFGFDAGYRVGALSTNKLTTGAFDIFIGYQAGLGSATQREKSVAIGYQAQVDADLTMALGGVGVNAISVVIGGTIASEKLHLVDGNFLAEDNYGLILGTGKDMKMFYDGSIGHLQTDLIAPSDFHLDCGTDKTLVLDETVWEDIQFSISSGRPGVANFPDWDAFTANTSEYKFDVDDYIDLGANEMAHWWKEGTAVYPHLHITTDGANNSGSSQWVKFTLYIAYADANEVWTETSMPLEKEIVNGTADLTHLLITNSSMALTNNLIGTQVKLRIKRIAATSGTEYPNHVFVTQVGFHAEVDTLGSREIGSK